MWKTRKEQKAEAVEWVVKAVVYTGFLAGIGYMFAGIAAIGH
jgi:hypothetical protein